MLALPLGILLLASCAPEGVMGLTGPLVLQASLLGVDVPEELDLSGTEYANRSLLQVFLSEAGDAGELEENAVSGAHVAVLAPGLGRVGLTSEGCGTYVADDRHGLRYWASEDYALQVGLDGDESAVRMRAPRAPDLPWTEEHELGASLTLSLREYDFDALLVVVADTVSGEITFTNAPQNGVEIHRFSNKERGQLQVEIPGYAFDEDSIYGVGVAGMHYAEEQQFEHLNSSLSNFWIGQMRFWPLYGSP